MDHWKAERFATHESQCSSRSVKRRKEYKVKIMRDEQENKGNGREREREKPI